MIDPASRLLPKRFMVIAMARPRLKRMAFICSESVRRIPLGPSTSQTGSEYRGSIVPTKINLRNRSMMLHLQPAADGGGVGPPFSSELPPRSAQEHVRHHLRSNTRRAD